MNQSKMDLYAVLGFGGLLIAVVTIAGAVLAKARTVAACAKACAHELLRLRAENARLKATPFGSHDCPACGRSTSHVCAHASEATR